MRAFVLILMASILTLPAQSLEDKARAKFESEGAVNMSVSELILLCHEYKRDADWHLQQGLAFKFRVAQLENVVQNMTNELMALYWHRDMLKAMREDEAKLTVAINALKAEVNELTRRRDDLRRLGRVSL
jgi:hypothetical protein